MQNLISLGVPTPIIQGVVYSLPARRMIIASDASVEVAQQIGGPFSAYSGGLSAYSFLRCPSANTVVTCKSVNKFVKASPFTPYVTAVMTDGASNYWRLNEPSGTTVVDSIGGANGTISGGVTLNQPGPVTGGKSMQFPGGNVRVLGVGSITIPLVASIEFWVKGPTFTSTPTVFSSRRSGTTGSTIVIWYPQQSHLAFYSTSQKDDFREVLDGAWHHCVWVMDGSTVVLYLDGIAGTVFAQTRTTPSVGPADIGWDESGLPTWGNLIAEVALYPLALSPAQIANHYSLR